MWNSVKWCRPSAPRPLGPSIGPLLGPSAPLTAPPPPYQPLLSALSLAHRMKISSWDSTPNLHFSISSFVKDTSRYHTKTSFAFVFVYVKQLFHKFPPKLRSVLIFSEYLCETHLRPLRAYLDDVCVKTTGGLSWSLSILLLNLGCWPQRLFSHLPP